MPKMHKAFPVTLNFGVDLDTKQKLVTIGYLRGEGGEISSPARNFLKRAIDEWYRNLSAQERRDFDEILANVRLSITK